MASVVLRFQNWNRIEPELPGMQGHDQKRGRASALAENEIQLSLLYSNMCNATCVVHVLAQIKRLHLLLHVAHRTS